MIMIFEGPDGGGKSTFAQTMAKHTKYKLYCRSNPRSESENLAMLEDYFRICDNERNFLMDRAWYSNLVYGPIMENQAVYTFEQMYALEKLLINKGAVIFYCTGDPGKMWDRAKARGEDYITNDIFVDICDAYDKLFLQMPHFIPVVPYVV